MKIINTYKKLHEAFGDGKNTHSQHSDDMPHLGGRRGMKWLLNMFRSIFEELKSADSTKTNVNTNKSLKLDGSPAAMVFTNFPGLNGVGVATKGLFAKDPKYATTSEECQQLWGHAPDLVRKMQYLLEAVPMMGIPSGEVWQGDFLFDHLTLKKEVIGGEECYTFHPNTIVYAVPTDSQLGQDLSTAKFGIAWHTRYTGSIQQPKANYNAKVNELQPVQNVFMTDPYIPTLSGKVKFSAEESNAIESKLSELETTYQMLDIEDLVANEDFTMLFSTFQNTLVRKGTQVIDPSVFAADFIQWITIKAQADIDSKKTEKGKAATTAKWQPLIQLAQDERIPMTVQLINSLTELKGKFIDKLNMFGQFKTYLKTLDGNVLTTNQEGFMISDQEGNAVKLVDRGEFSKMNFSTDILKGWQKPGTQAETVAEEFIKKAFLETVPLPMNVMQYGATGHSSDSLSKKRPDDSYSNKRCNQCGYSGSDFEISGPYDKKGKIATGRMFSKPESYNLKCPRCGSFTSFPANMIVKEFVSILKTKLNEGVHNGFTYETNALSSLKELGICEKSVQPAGASHDKPDLTVYRKKLGSTGVELKLSPTAAGSLVVKFSNGKWSFGEIGDNEEKQFLADLAKEAKVLEIMNGEHGNHPWSKFEPHIQIENGKKKVLASSEKEAYELDIAQYSGKNEVKIPVSTAISDYYTKKHCSYINVGTHGFYTFGGKDDLKLQDLVGNSIPDFNKNSVTEIRVRCQYKGSGKYQFTMTLQFKGMKASPFNIAPLMEDGFSINEALLKSDALVQAWSLSNQK